MISLSPPAVPGRDSSMLPRWPAGASVVRSVWPDMLALWPRWRGLESGTGVPGVGGETKSLNELSVTRGCFHGNRRRVMQQKMIANDHMSVAVGSYFRSSYTSGARYGSEPTIPGNGQLVLAETDVQNLPDARTISFSKGYLNTVALPKSINFMIPFSLTTTLSNFRSRCANPIECR